MQISALGRSLLQSLVLNGDTERPLDLLDDIESMDSAYTRRICIPKLGTEAYFHSNLGIDSEGEFFTKIDAHVPLVGIFVEEGSINIAKRNLPEAKWETYLRLIQGNGPVSDIINMGSAHETPILDREINHSGKPHFTIKFDPDPRPWDTFRSQLLATAANLVPPSE